MRAFSIWNAPSSDFNLNDCECYPYPKSNLVPANNFSNWSTDVSVTTIGSTNLNEMFSESQNELQSITNQSDA